MIKVGITGGIGSGKSTFCREWESLGATVIYADDLAKQLMIEDQALVKNIKSVFGDQSYHKDGTLNREFLAQEAFAKGRVEELNELVHPVLWERVAEIEAEERAKGTTIFAKEAAILLNNGRPTDLDYVILITADEQTRIQRVLQRDHTDSEKVKERIKKQSDFMELSRLCDYIITNNGTQDELKLKAKELFHQLLEL